MEQRLGKISIGLAGGTASHGSKTYKLTIPSSWIEKLGINDENRQVSLSFDGERIIITPITSMESFKGDKMRLGHSVYAFRYYDSDKLCTLIYADVTDHTLQVENYTTRMIKTAFGKKEMPTWKDLMTFIAERCIPRERAGLREYLDSIGVEEYDPIKIVEKTKGRMAEDQQWLEIEVLQ